MIKEFPLAYCIIASKAKIGFVYGKPGEAPTYRTQGQISIKKEGPLLAIVIDAEDPEFNLSFTCPIETREDVYFFSVKDVPNDSGTFAYNLTGYPIMIYPGDGNTIFGSFSRIEIPTVGNTESSQGLTSLSNEDSGQWGSGSQGL